VGVVKDNMTSGSDYKTFSTGFEAAKTFSVDIDAQQLHLSVAGSSGDTDFLLALGKSLTNTNQYGFFAYEEQIYGATLLDWQSYLDENALLEKVKELPKSFDPETDKKAVDVYRHFFATVGSHVISSVWFGSKYNFVSAKLECLERTISDDLNRLHGREILTKTLMATSVETWLLALVV
jgi:hypothetical protein